MTGATEQLFRTLNLSATYAGTFSVRETPWSEPVSLLPFTGRQLAGSLLLAAPLQLMVLTNPSGESSLESLVDWSRELTNLLLGSLKTALLQREIVIEIGVPTSIVGHDVRLAAPGDRAIGLLFVDGEHRVHLVLDVYLDEDLEIREGVELTQPIDVLLF